jgi:hypothetical protein
MYRPLLGAVALGVFAALGAATTEAQAAGLDTAAFVAACAEDPVNKQDRGFAEAKVTTKVYCECVARKLQEGHLKQAAIDMLTKMHSDEITDEDAVNYPKLDDLMAVNEGYEDACKESLGVVSDDDSDMGEMPDDMPDEAVPDEGEGPPQE